jgi:hypothetical protein
MKLRIAFITLSLCMLGLGLILQYEMRFMAPTTFTDAHGHLWKLKLNDKLPDGICGLTIPPLNTVEYRDNKIDKCGDPQATVLHEISHVCLGIGLSGTLVGDPDGITDVHDVIYLLAPCQYDIFKNNPQLKHYIFQ